MTTACPSLRIPTHALPVPWPKEIFESPPSPIYANWRLEQRDSAPKSIAQKYWNKKGSIGLPPNQWIDFDLHCFLSMMTRPQTLLVVYQNNEGGIHFQVERTEVKWSDDDGLPYLIVEGCEEPIWGPFILCVAPLTSTAKARKSDEPYTSSSGPVFLKIVRDFGMRL